MVYQRHKQYNPIESTSLFLIAFLFFAAVWTASCAERTCTGNSPPSLFVIVLDGENNQQVLKEVDEISYVSGNQKPQNCIWYDKQNNIARYPDGQQNSEDFQEGWSCGMEDQELTVTVRLGDRSVSKTFQVSADRCHVITEEVSIILP